MSEFNDIENFTDEQLEEFYRLIGSNVARLRKKYKLTQLRLSEMLNHTSTSLVSGAEIYYKKQHFNLEHLLKISFVLNEDISEFFKNHKRNI